MVAEKVAAGGEQIWKSYRILSADSADELQKAVSAKVQDGSNWREAGGLCVDKGVFYQAITKNWK